MPDIQVRDVRFLAQTSGGVQEIRIPRFHSPKGATFYATEATVNGSPSGIVSSAWGVTDGIKQYNSGTSQGRQETSESSIIKVLNGATKLAEAEFLGWLNNGILIRWIVQPNAAYIINMRIFGGLDLQAEAGKTLCEAATVSGLSFQPTTVISTAVAISGSFTDEQQSIGIAHDNGASVDNRAIAFDNQIIRDDAFVVIGGARCTINSFTADGWNQSSTGSFPAARDDYGFLALNLSGINAKLMTVDSPTATGNQSTTGVGFKPGNIFLLSSELTAVNTAGNRANFVGQFDQYSQFSSGVYGSGNSYSNTKAIHTLNNAGTTLHEATFVSFDADGFTLNYTTADATIRKWVVFAIEEQPQVEHLVSGDASMSGSGSVDSPVTVVEAQVGASNEDAEERVDNGACEFGSSDLELNFDTSSPLGSNYDQIVGTRHNNVNVPKGATIENAYVQFTVDEADSGPISIDITLEAIDNAPVFATGNFNISSRTRTTGTVNWKPPAWNTVGEAGVDQRTPDISALVKEIIDRSGWSSGNAIAVIYEPAADTTSGNQRTGESYNGSPSGAPILHIEYSEAAPSTGTLVSGDATLSATGTVGHAGTAALVSSAASLSGSGSVSNPNSGTASLVSGPASLSATGKRGSAGTAALVSGDASLSASGIKVNQVIHLWSGAVTQNSFRVNARLTEEVDVALVVSENSDLSSPVFTSSAQSISTANDKVSTFDATGLNPNTQYYYGITTQGKPDLNYVGECKTLPTNGTLKIVFSGDQTGGSNHQVFDRIVAEAPHLFIHMGDMHYADIGTNNPQLFRDQYNNNFTADKFKNLAQKFPWNYIWDDHDYGPNDSDEDNPAKAAAAQAYREYFPHYPLELSGNDAIYHSFSVGNVKFIFTDCRFYKSPKGDTDNASKTMLGAAQKTWFKAQLADGKNNHKLTVWYNSLPWIVSQTSGADNWGGYTTERQELADEIKALGFRTDELIQIAADMHAIAFDDGSNSGYATGGGGAFTVLHGAPLDRTGSTKGGPYSEGVSQQNNDQYVVLELFDNGGHAVQWIATGKYQGSAVMSLSGGENVAVLQSGDASLAANDTTITGGATLQSGNASLSGTGKVGHTGTASLQSSDAQISATGQRGSAGPANLVSGDASLSGSGTVEHTGTATLVSGDASLSATGARGSIGSATLVSGNASLSASGKIGHVGTAALSSGDAELSASGSIGGNISGTAALESGDASLSGSGTITHIGTATLVSADAQLSASGLIGHVGNAALVSQDASLSASGSVGSNIAGSASLSSGDASLIASGFIAHTGVATLISGAATLNASGEITHTGTANLVSGAATLSGVGELSHVGSAMLISSDATLNASGSIGGNIGGAGALVSGDASLSASGQVGHVGNATLVSGDAGLSASGTVSGTSTGTATLQSSDATLSAVGTLGHQGVANLVSSDATLSGSGVVANVGTATLQSGDATLTGSGDISHAGAAILVSGDASLNATGTISHVGTATLISADATLSASGMAITDLTGVATLVSGDATLAAVGLAFEPILETWVTADTVELYRYEKVELR